MRGRRFVRPRTLLKPSNGEPVMPTRARLRLDLEMRLRRPTLFDIEMVIVAALIAISVVGTLRGAWSYLAGWFR